MKTNKKIKIIPVFIENSFVMNITFFVVVAVEFNLKGIIKDLLLNKYKTKLIDFIIGGIFPCIFCRCTYNLERERERGREGRREIDNESMHVK